MAKKHISDILKRLMFEKDIKTMELSRRTNLPQPTLQRIVSGTSPSPHLSTLLPIATFFGITVEQLKGLAPIPEFETSAQTSTIGLAPVPLITWDEAAKWPEIMQEYQSSQSTKTLFVEDKIGPHAFALTIQDSSMHPLFPEGTEIIIDPVKPIKDRCYVVVGLKDQPQALFRQLLIDANKHYLKALNPDLEQFPMTLMHEGDRICGVLIQARKDFG